MENLPRTRLLFSPDRRLPLVSQAKNHVDAAVIATLQEINGPMLEGRQAEKQPQPKLDVCAQPSLKSKLSALQTPTPMKKIAPRPPCDRMDAVPSRGATDETTPNVLRPSSSTAAESASFKTRPPRKRNGRFKCGQNRCFGADITNHDHSVHQPSDNFLSSPGIVRKFKGRGDFSAVGVVESTHSNVLASPGTMPGAFSHTPHGGASGGLFCFPLSSVLEATLESSRGSSSCTTRTFSTADSGGTQSRSRPRRPRRPPGNQRTGDDPNNLGGKTRTGARNPRQGRGRSRSLRSVENEPEERRKFATSDAHCEPQPASVFHTPKVTASGSGKSVKDTPSAANFISPQPWMHGRSSNPFATPQFAPPELGEPSNDDVTNLLIDLEEIERRVANRATPSPSPCPGIAPGQDSPTESVLRGDLSPHVVRSMLDELQDSHNEGGKRNDMNQVTIDALRDCADCDQFESAGVGRGSSDIVGGKEASHGDTGVVSGGEAEQRLLCAEATERSVSSTVSSLSSVGASDASGTLRSLGDSAFPFVSSGSLLHASLDDGVEVASNDSWRWPLKGQVSGGEPSEMPRSFLKTRSLMDHDFFDGSAPALFDCSVNNVDGDELFVSLLLDTLEPRGAVLGCTRQNDRNMKFRMTIIPEEDPVLFAKVSDSMKERDATSYETAADRVLQGGNDVRVADPKPLRAASPAASALQSRSGPSENSDDFGRKTPLPTSRLGRSTHMDAYGQWMTSQCDEHGFGLDIIRTRDLSALSKLACTCDVEMRDSHGNVSCFEDSCSLHRY